MCIAHNNCMSCSSIWATLSALLINILLGSFSCFCIVISLSLEGWNNPVQRCLPVGEAALSTPEAVVASRTDWQTALMQPTTTSGNIITQSIIFSFSISLTLRVFCIERSNITTLTHSVSNCRVRQLQFFGIFVALGFCTRYHGND